MACRFRILDTIHRQYRQFNAAGMQMTVQLVPPIGETDPVRHFIASVNDLFEHALENINDSDMVEITIHNQMNQNDKPIGLSFRRKYQLSADVIWSVFQKDAVKFSVQCARHFGRKCVFG